MRGVSGVRVPRAGSLAPARPSARFDSDSRLPRRSRAVAPLDPLSPRVEQLGPGHDHPARPLGDRFGFPPRQAVRVHVEQRIEPDEIAVKPQRWVKFVRRLQSALFRRLVGHDASSLDPVPERSTRPEARLDESNATGSRNVQRPLGNTSHWSGNWPAMPRERSSSGLHPAPPGRWWRRAGESPLRAPAGLVAAASAAGNEDGHRDRDDGEESQASDELAHGYLTVKKPNIDDSCGGQ
jgi:hypothetical protein